MSVTESQGLQGKKFQLEWCPECGLLHLGPTAPWHAMDCSGPDLEKWIAQFVGRVDEVSA